MMGQTNLILTAENLRDIGCSESDIEYCLQLGKEGKAQEQFILLTRHRAELLERLHTDQHRIDCLDYLLYQYKKERKNAK